MTDLDAPLHMDEPSDARTPVPDDDLTDTIDLPRQPRAREGLPAGYRMRADAHYVEQLASRAPAREQLLDARSIESSGAHDAATLGPLVESIRRRGVLVPLLVRNVDGRYQVIDGRKRLAAALAAGVYKVPCIQHDVDDQEAAALTAAANIRPDVAARPPAPAAAPDPVDVSVELARLLSSLAVCARMLSGSVSELSREVTSRLISAEVARAAGLLQSSRVNRKELPVVRAPIAVRQLIDDVCRDAEAERSLRSVQLDRHSRVHEDTQVTGDRALLTLAVLGALRATFALLDESPDARAAVAATSEPAGYVSITVSQHAVSAPDVWFARAFDPGWTGRPGGVAAAAAMLALQRVADAHGGRADALAAGRGTSINLVLPAAR